MFTPPVPEGSVLAGKYRVEQVLGRGGMGVVLAAWHLELDQRVALKFLGANLAESPDAAERFRREARAAARIRSEHVVRVLDVGVLHGNVPYMVMEYLEGNDLDEELAKNRVLSVVDAIDYVLQAIEAIAEAHAAGIVHRDLKPGNLFLFCRPDGTKMIKVLDFGISKSLPSALASANQMALTATASLIGSPLYMSPEQMQSPRSVDTRTDIWSLGAILYHLLAGEPPYQGENIAQLCSQLMNSTPVPLTKRRADVPPELDRAIARCLERDRDKRFSNVSDLASALARFGTSSSQVHVSRAARILSSSDAEVRSPSLRADDAVVEGNGTQSAWDKDQSRRIGGRSLRWLLPAAIGLFVLLGVGVALFPRDVPEPTNTSTVNAAKAPPEPPEEPEVSAGPASSTANALPAAIDAPPIAPAENAAPVASAAPSASVAPPPVVHQPRNAAPAAWSRPAPAKPSAAAPGGENGLTDFGGRR